MGRKSMSGGANICPPGFFCMDTGFVALISIVLLAILVAAFIYRQKEDSTSANAKSPQIIIVDRDRNHEKEPTISNIKPNSQYPPPDRDYETYPDTRGFIPPPGVRAVPIQVPTQGLPQEFQQMGVLTAPGGSSTSATPNRTLLPLFGRKVAVSRERYNYYTRTDGYNPIQIPVTFKNRKCDDDNGCDEIMDGDTVGAPIIGQSFVATVYRYNTPRYIPTVY